MVHVQKETCFGLSLTPRTIFKICSHFSKNAIFEKFVKFLSPQKFQLFSVFQSGAPRCSHARSELIEILVKEGFFPKACIFTFFAPKLSITKNHVHEHANIL